MVYASVSLAINKLFDFRNRTLPPIHVRLEPTETCNLRCNFCVWHNPEAHKRIQGTVDMSDRFWNKTRAITLIDELSEIGTKCVSFTGAGDPLTYPHITEVLEKCHENDLRVGLTSNFSMHVNKELIRQLIRCEWIRWSQNVSDEESHLLIHNQKAKAHTHERARSNIRSLVSELQHVDSCHKLKSSVVVNNLTTRYLKKIANTAVELGVKRISFRPDVPLYMKRKVSYTLEQMKLFEEMIKTIPTTDLEIDYSETRDELTDFREQELADLTCQYSAITTYIAANFDVYPCCYTRLDKSFVLGNVATTSFSEFWWSQHRKISPDSIVLNTCPPCPHVEENRQLAKLQSLGSEQKKDSYLSNEDFI